MHSTIDVTPPSPASPPRVNVTADDLYILAPRRNGICWTWRGNADAFYNKREHRSLPAAQSEAMQFSVLTPVHFVDPITAVSLGMVTIEELLTANSYPEGFIALLNLLKIN